MKNRWNVPKRAQDQMSEKDNSHNRDISSKTVFHNAVLCAQFLRDNVDIPILKNIQPEDIEDVSERYRPYLGTEFGSDTVKRIHIFDKEGREREPVFLVSLIEHKSSVDYDVAMQLLRYMMCIWTEYRREMEALQKGITKRKNFRYPMIIPIVYYEGKAAWTADIHLKERISGGEAFLKWLPDFQYEVIRVHDYSNEELLARGDEMSLIMLVNKIQDAADLSEFSRLPHEEVNRIIKDSPGTIIDILASVIESLCIKIGATSEETEQCVRKVKEREMGYLFENMEKMNIQEERQKTAEATRKLECANRKVEEVQREMEEVNQRISEADKKTEETIRILVEICQETGMTKEGACARLKGKLKEILKMENSKTEIEIEKEVEAKVRGNIDKYWK